jgi:hypothetical protein
VFEGTNAVGRGVDKMEPLELIADVPTGVDDVEDDAILE